MHMRFIYLAAGILTGQHKHDSSQLVFRRDAGSLKKAAADLGLDTEIGVRPEICRKTRKGKWAGTGRP